MFRGLGGGRDVEIKAATPTGIASPAVAAARAWPDRRTDRRPSFDGEALRLPDRIDCLSASRRQHGALSLACCCYGIHRSAELGRRPAARGHPYLAGRTAHDAPALTECPGLRRVYASLYFRHQAIAEASLASQAEAAVEAAILHLLGDAPPKDGLALAIASAVHGQASDLSAFAAPRGLSAIHAGSRLARPARAGGAAKGRPERTNTPKTVNHPKPTRSAYSRPRARVRTRPRARTASYCTSSRRSSHGPSS